MWPFILPSAGTVVLSLAAIGTTSLAGLASLWAANPRQPWLVRLTPIGLFLALLFPIGCFEYAFIFAVQSLLIMAVFAGARTIQRRRNRLSALGNSANPGSWPESSDSPYPRFTLARALLGLTLAGALLALVSYRPDEFDSDMWSRPRNWLRVSIAGAGLAAVTLAAWAVVVQRRRRAIVLAVLLIPAAAFVARFSDFTWWVELVWTTKVNWLVSIGFVGSHVALLAALLWLLRRSGWHWWAAPAVVSPAGSSRAARTALVVALSLLLFPLVYLYFALLPPAMPTEPPMPDPNGYGLLVELAKQIDTTALPGNDPDAATPAQLQQYLRDNAAVFAALAAALELPSQPAIDYRAMDRPTRYADLRSLFFIWSAAAKAAASRGDDAQAVSYYINNIRAGNVCANGGLAIDELVGNAMTSDSIDQIRMLLDRLTEPQLAALQVQLRQVMAGREPIELIIQRSQLHERLSMGWGGRLLLWLEARGLAGFDVTTELPRLRAHHDAQIRLLLAACAVERHHLGHDAYPESLDILVPDYLESIPPDPLGVGNLKYRLTDSGYLLYSVGRNGIDDGGVPPTQQADYEDGDLLIGP